MLSGRLIGGLGSISLVSTGDALETYGDVGFSDTACPQPADKQVGDLLIVCCIREGSQTSIVETTEWTQRDTIGGSYVNVFDRIATGDSNDTCTITGSSANTTAAETYSQMIALRPTNPNSTISYDSVGTAQAAYDTGVTTWYYPPTGSSVAAANIFQLAVYMRRYNAPGTTADANTVNATPHGYTEIGNSARSNVWSGTTHGLWLGWAYSMESAPVEYVADDIAYAVSQTNNAVYGQTIRWTVT